MSKTYAVPPAAPQNHGWTLAARVMLIGVLAGSVVAALGLILASMLIMIIGAAVIVGSLILSAVLRAMGHGQPEPESRIITR